MAGRHLVAEERTDLVSFLRTLAPEDWEAPSLCEGWRVRDVAAHLLYDAMPLHRYVLEVLAAGFSTDRVNRRVVERSKDMDACDLVDVLERSVRSGIVARLSPSIALADVLVHHQDIRRPLRRPRTIPSDRLLRVLERPDRFAVPRGRTKGLRFVATDVSWSSGDGPEVRGTGEAIVMAVAGRRSVLEELSGEGVPALSARLARR
jgi:uncharacterized protein (TIGR03083 family)